MTKQIFQDIGPLIRYDIMMLVKLLLVLKYLKTYHKCLHLINFFGAYKKNIQQNGRLESPILPILISSTLNLCTQYPSRLGDFSILTNPFLINPTFNQYLHGSTWDPQDYLTWGHLIKDSSMLDPLNERSTRPIHLHQTLLMNHWPISTYIYPSTQNLLINYRSTDSLTHPLSINSSTSYPHLVKDQSYPSTHPHWIHIWMHAITNQVIYMGHPSILLC